MNLSSIKDLSHTSSKDIGSDLMNDLRAFIAGAAKKTSKGHVDIGLARTALSLLKTLPASREAVLEYFCSLFDKVVGRYIDNAKVRVTVYHDFSALLYLPVV